jgi:hypothetical protein
MPKYTHKNLEVYLKQDAKQIKKINSQLKLSNVLNLLSKLLGYKNFNELQKRDLDTKTILLISIEYYELKSLLNKYKNFVEAELIKNKSEPNIGYYFVSKLEYLRDVTKMYSDISDDPLLPEKYIDFTDNKTAIIFDNENFIKIINFHIKTKSKNQIDKISCNLSSENFLLIVDLMSHFNIKNFQKEIVQWTELNFLLDSLTKINDKKLKLRLNSYIDSIDCFEQPLKKYQNHQRIFSSFINLMLHPFFNINESKYIFKFKHIENNYTDNEFKQYKKIWLIFNKDYFYNRWFEFIARN